jgi:hypothetical protein
MHGVDDIKDLLKKLYSFADSLEERAFVTSKKRHDQTDVGIIHTAKSIVHG